MSKIDNNISEDEIVSAIKQAGKDKDSIRALQSISKSDLEDLLERESGHKVKQDSGEFRRGKSYISYILYSAISIAAIVAIVVTINISNDKPGKELFLAYYAIPDNEITISRGGISDLSPEIQKLTDNFYDLYNKKQYDDALKSVTSAVGDDELKKCPELLFYISICQLELNKTSDAEKNLKQLSKLGDSFSHFQAVDWYLALTFLKINQTDNAKSLLEKIKDEKRYYSDKATEILTKMK